MALNFSKFLRGGARIPTPSNAGEVVAVRYEHTLTAAQNVTGDIIDLGVLPANLHVIDAVLDSDDLDTDGTPAVLLDVGVMSGQPGEALDEDGNARTCGAEFFSGATVGQAGGTVRMSAKGGFRVAAVGYDRSIGLKVATQADVAAAGVVGLTVLLGTG